ncbi:MAG: CBS domain-containing protein [Candidatus Krumholzibacteriia bacterium]
MMIKELLAQRGERPVFSVLPDDTVFDAVTNMVRKNVGAMLVIKDGNIYGIMTERDYLRFVTVQGRTARDTPVREIMTRKVIYATPDTSCEEVMAIMTDRRIRHLPIIDGTQLQGIVSIGDVVKQVSRDQEVHIRYLEEYIADDYPGPKRTPVASPRRPKGE